MALHTLPEGLIARAQTDDLAVIFVGSTRSLGDLLIPSAGAASGAAWPAANRAIFIPFEVHAPRTFNVICWVNGSSVSGNVDAGLYDLSGNRLVSVGSTAQSGVNSIQQVAITATTLSAGVYYMALAMDNNSGVQFRYSAGIAAFHQMFGLQQAVSGFPLPSTATLVNPTSAYIPKICVGTNTVL